MIYIQDHGDEENNYDDVDRQVRFLLYFPKNYASDIILNISE